MVVVLVVWGLGWVNLGLVWKGSSLLRIVAALSKANLAKDLFV